jgi:hypothetical protein
LRSPGLTKTSRSFANTAQLPSYRTVNTAVAKHFDFGGALDRLDARSGDQRVRQRLPAAVRLRHRRLARTSTACAALHVTLDKPFSI